MYPDIPTGEWSFSFPKGKDYAWIPGESYPMVIDEPQEWPLKPEKNMREYGNFPPFFFCDQANWAKKEILFGPTLQKFKYVQQTSSVNFPNGEIRTFYGWFLERDVATFAELQPPESATHQRVSLMDAVLGKPFHIVGFDSKKKFTLFAEEGDTPQTKWFKAILLKTIFSTVPGSFKNVLEVGKHEDPFLGPLQTVTLYTRKRGVEIGAEAAFTFKGVISPVANVRLVALEKERQKRKEEGKEDDTDIDEKTKTSRDTFIEQLTRGPNTEILFTNIQEPQREAAKILLRGIFSYKLGKSFELRGENTRYNESKRQIFRTDAPTLLSIGRQNIQAARTALGDSFDAVYAALMNNLVQIQTNLEEGTDLKDILAIPFELPLTGGGPATISNEKWNEFFEPDSLDEFPIIEISVKQKSVYYPDSLLHKYIAGRDT
jgi:hypothetical protein